MSERVPRGLSDTLGGIVITRWLSGSWGSCSVRLTLLAAVIAVGFAACGGSGEGLRGTSATGPSESGGIVVESTTLRSVKECSGPPRFCFSSCDVTGTVRNDTGADRKVTLTFIAFDKDGRNLNTVGGFCVFAPCGPATVKPAAANGGELIVPAQSRSTYIAHLLESSGCGSVDRLEITQLSSVPAM